MPDRRPRLRWMLAPLLVAPFLSLSLPVAARTTASDDQATRAYMLGRLYAAFDDYGAAVRQFDDALKQDDDAVARDRLLDLAVVAGDRKAAVRLARGVSDSWPSGGPLADSLPLLVRMADAASRGDWASYGLASKAFLTRQPGGASGESLGLLFELWGKAGAGDLDGALTLADPGSGRGIAASYLREQQANLLALAGRWPDAATAYGALVEREGGNVARLRIAAAGAVLEAKPGDAAAREQAILLLAGGPDGDPLLRQARAALVRNPSISGRKLADFVSSPRRGLALLFVRLAVDLGRERANQSAIHFARLATFTDPSLADGWMVSADVLARDDRQDLALKALDNLPKGAAWQELAELRRAAILSTSNRMPEALAILQRRAARADSSAEDQARLADLQRQDKNYPEAIDAYGRALDRVPAADAALRAQLLFLRGATRQEAGDWQRAEPDLSEAVARATDNPIYLNYLGYSLIEHGGDLQQARSYIARAYELAPENGAITDSMGWIEHLLGNGREAVRLLEEAQSAEPGDPTVADHLGDALWTVGRRIDAMNAWRTAAGLSPDEALASALTHKLMFGLAVAPARE